MEIIKSQSLRGISDEHDIVVYDTSIVICAGVRKDMNIPSDLEMDLNKCDNLVTHFDVYKEAHGVMRRLTKNTRQCGFNLGRVYSAALEYLMPTAQRRGIIDTRKERPMTDVRLAALAFATAHHRRSVAFVSSDRELNSMICNIYGLCNQNGSDFPFSLNNLDVYSYIQSRHIFVSYVDE